MIIKSNSIKAAMYVDIFSPSEHPFEEGDFTNGIYIGKTAIYRQPFFLNPDSLVNPHVAILGTTGSGKTFLVKSLVAKYRIDRGYNILILDWNSEYSGVVNALSGRVWKAAGDDALEVSKLLDGINSVDLSGIEIEHDKLHFAAALLASVLKYRISKGADRELDTIVVIDEAWKLINSDKSIAKMFREGRKFGLGVIAATQLTNDVDNEVLANAACSFIFRLQGSGSLGGLVTSGLLDSGHLEKVRSLKRGSCLVSLAYREDRQVRHFLIEKVQGGGSAWYGDV